MAIGDSKIGNIYLSAVGDYFIVLSVNGNEALVKFLDTGGERLTHINKLYDQSHIKDYYKRSVCGVGYLGCDPRTLRNDPNYRSIYQSWVRMLQRVYSNYGEYSHNYGDTSVCAEWLCFFNFYGWAKYRYIKGYHLDKDINQVTKGKEYNKENCSYVEGFKNSQQVHNRVGFVYIFEDTNTGVLYETENPSSLAAKLGMNKTSLSKLIIGTRKKCKGIILKEIIYDSVT